MQTGMSDKFISISHRRGVGKVKHLEPKELWVQDKVDEGELEVRKIGTDKNWSDIGTKALECNRITQLVEMMPLKRGLVVASLFMAAKAQDPEEPGNVDYRFLLYLLKLHVLAVIGLVHLWKRAGQVVRSTGCQVQIETAETNQRNMMSHQGGRRPQCQRESPRLLTKLSSLRVGPRETV